MLEACENGETKIVELLLERCNFEESGLNTKDEDGATALMWACFNGHKGVVKLLLKHSERIELNASTNSGWTAFMEACHDGHKDVVQLLLDHSDSNIDLNARIHAHMAFYMLRNFDEPEDAGQLILDHPNMFGMNTGVIDGFTAFMIACSKGHKDVVQLLMDHSERIDLNARNTGWTAFTMACLFKRKDVVKLLLEYPEVIDINVPESFPLSKDIKDLIELHSILENVLILNYL